MPKPLPVGKAGPTPPFHRPAWDRGNEREGRDGRAATPCPLRLRQARDGPAPRPPRFLLVPTPDIGCRARQPGPARPEGAAPGQGSRPGELKGAGPAGATHPARCSQRTPRCSGAASTWLPPPTCREPSGRGHRRRRRRRRFRSNGSPRWCWLRRLSPQRLAAAAQHARAGRCPSATGRSCDRKGHAALSPS